MRDDFAIVAGTLATHNVPPVNLTEVKSRISIEFVKFFFRFGLNSRSLGVR